MAQFSVFRNHTAFKLLTVLLKWSRVKGLFCSVNL